MPRRDKLPRKDRPDGAVLTDEGRKLFGHIFLDGRVPLRYMVPSMAHLGDYHGPVYMADYNEFTDEQQKQIRELLVRDRGVPEDKVDELLKQFNYCIPLRAEYVKVSYSEKILRHI